MILYLLYTPTSVTSDIHISQHRYLRTGTISAQCSTGTPSLRATYFSWYVFTCNDSASLFARCTGRRNMSTWHMHQSMSASRRPPWAGRKPQGTVGLRRDRYCARRSWQDSCLPVLHNIENLVSLFFRWRLYATSLLSDHHHFQGWICAIRIMERSDEHVMIGYSSSKDVPVSINRQIANSDR